MHGGRVADQRRAVAGAVMETTPTPVAAAVADSGAGQRRHEVSPSRAR